jgi:hypothetical protein
MSKQNNIQRFSNIDNINKNTKLLELMKEAQNNAKEQIKIMLQTHGHTNIHKNINEKFFQVNDTATPTITIPSATPTITIPTATPTITIPTATPTITIPSATPTITIPSSNSSVTLPNLIDRSSYYVYNSNLDNLQTWLDKNTSELLNKIKIELDKYNENREENKDKILILLTNIYVLNYIYKLNKDNAEVYKVYLKYNDPKKNMYYKPYLD